MNDNLNNLLAQLHDIAGEGNVFGHGEIDSRYRVDWTAGDVGQPVAVVRPRSTQEVSEVLSLCSRLGQAVVTQGGRTGMVRGGTARRGELIVSTELLNAIEEIDPSAAVMRLQAGVPLQKAQAAAAEAELSLPMDLGARGSATIGGMIATNAGGNRVVRYGMTRDSVLGLEVVLADGSILESLQPFVKNNAGYDLKHLFIGSEGTLGLVTRAVLRLRPPNRSQSVALCGVESLEQATGMLRYMEGCMGGQVTAFEVMWNSFYVAVSKLPGAPCPLPLHYPVYVLIESLGADPSTDVVRFERALSAALDTGALADAVIAGSGREAHDIWRVRDSIGELLARMKAFAPFDVSLPVGEIAAFVGEVSQHLAASVPGRDALFFGHLGDNNLHIVVELESATEAHPVEQLVYGLLRGRLNSVSAEHGIGLLKRDYLSYSRSVPEIELMRRLKGLLDPRNILNPGRIVSLSGTATTEGETYGSWTIV
jgi:FAD/FMN-containing dehydrogenase